MRRFHLFPLLAPAVLMAAAREGSGGEPAEQPKTDTSAPKAKASGGQSSGDPVATGNEAPAADPAATQLTNATARTPMEDRTAAAQTRPLKDDDETGNVATATSGGPDINGDRMPAAENLPGAQASRTPPAELMLTGSGATSGGRAPSVEADMTKVRVKVDRAAADPLPLNVHGVGRWDLRVGQEYDLPEDAVVALENSGAGVTRIESENQKASRKARSGERG